MQTLTVGSFLNLENAESVEALKSTARRLAEHTATVATAENLNAAAALENLANSLWDKAEYVTRETERRKLREIFAQNFTERFRELKPEVMQADATEAQGKRDEFLGFVKTDEPFAATSIAKTEAATATITAPEEAEPRTVQTINAPFSETVESENKTVAARDVTNSQNEQVAVETEVSAENPNIEQSLRPATSAGNNSQAVSANKNSADTAAVGQEPFEFGKCTINLNLVLLPSSGDAKSRKAIVSAASHNLPPEIEFLEISEGEDLTEIADLVRDKLARFKQTLPAKYIERLRASKTKSAKSGATAKPSTSVAAPTRAEINQPNVEKTGGLQPAQDLSGTDTENSRAEITTAKGNAAVSTAPVVAVPQRSAANNVQPSLF